MKQKWKWALWVVLTATVLGGCSWAWLRKKPEDDTCTVLSVVRKDSLRENITGSGEIQPKTRVNVGVQVTAAIREIHVKDGQWVKAGDVLVTLDQEQYRQVLNQSTLGLGLAKKDLSSAEKTFRKLQQTFERQERLFSQGLLANEDFQQAKLNRDTAETAFERAKVATQQAEAQVALAEDSLSKTVIRASMSGQITGLRAEKGETAIAGQTNLAGAVLMVISDMSEMLAEIKVGELEVVKLKVGQRAEITIDAIPGRVFQGRVVSVAKGAEAGAGGSGQGYIQAAQNYRVRVQIDGDRGALESLCPGMSARVAVLANETKNVLAVPLSAIQDRDSRIEGGLGLMKGVKNVVYLVKNGVAEERTIRMGMANRQFVEILDGVREGELVVTGPPKILSSLSNGKAVKTKAESAGDGKGK